MSLLEQNIRSERVSDRKRWDWGFLNDCFEHGIRPTDINGLANDESNEIIEGQNVGMVERKLRFLFLEGKTMGQELPKGQRLSLQRLACEREYTTGLFTKTLIIVEGHPPNDVKRIGIFNPRTNGLNMFDADQGRLKLEVRKWYRKVDKG